MYIKIELTDSDLKQLVIKELKATFGETQFDATKLHIMVKSKQNYKSEWETASFKAVYEAQ